MRRATWSVVFAGLVLAVLATAPAGRSNRAFQDQPVFRSANDVVRVFVTVSDSSGRLVTRLGQESFEVRDRGRLQPIEVFDNTPVPIRLLLMLDVSGSMHGNIAFVREATENLIAHLGPRDLARLGSFGMNIRVGTAFSRDPSTLLAALPTSVPATAPTPLWSALDTGLQVLGAQSDARRVLLVVSDGKNTPIAAGGNITSEDIVERARQSDVMIYAIGVRSRLSNRFVQPGSLNSALEDDLPDPVLARVAADTGGGYVELRRGEDLKQELARIADELRSQYLLGFTPSVRDGKVHEVKVSIKQRGMKARARRDYVAPAR